MLSLGLVLQGCGVFENFMQHERSDGVYHVRVNKGKAMRQYVTFDVDSIVTYPLVRTDGRLAPDGTKGRLLVRPESTPEGAMARYRFAKTSVDLDLTTVLFKYRPSRGDLPAQLNTQFNLAVYSGYRRDFFTLVSRRDPLQRSRREFRHWGFDTGVLAGIGTASINPWVTRQAIEAEYDGFVLQTGIAAYAGINDLAAGLCLGFDYLTDSNRKHWVYHKKPWIGLAIGLALN